MFRQCLTGAALTLLLATSAAQAQVDTGYYGGGDYRRYYAYGRDYPFGWYGFPGPSFGFVFGPPVRERIVYYLAPPTVDGPKPAPVTLDVRVPAEAELWIEGKKVNQDGEVRRLVSPPLQPGQRYTYDFRVIWKENGHEIKRSRTVEVSAGERYTVDFVNPPKLPGKIQDFPAPKK
jgi:uncharacterized protein (TIGR03000 family)